MTCFTDHAPLRSERFSFDAPTLWRPRLRLYEDQVELSGWRWCGRYRREIPFHHILQVDVSGDVLILWLAQGSTLRLRVGDPTEWKDAIDVCLDSPR